MTSQKCIKWGWCIIKGWMTVLRIVHHQCHVTHPICSNPGTSPVQKSSGLSPVLRNIPPQDWLLHQPILSPGSHQGAGGHNGMLSCVVVCWWVRLGRMDGGAHQWTMRNDKHHHLSFGCHIDVDVAPGILVKRYRGRGWGLTLLIVHHHHQTMLDCCCRCVVFMMVDVVEERCCQLLLMAKSSIGIFQCPF